MSEEKNKPVLDESTLAKLLEAAYVLQEHNREMQELELCLELRRDQMEAEDRANNPKVPSAKVETPAPQAPADYTLTLARIVETQHHIQVRHLDLTSALSLVAERVAEIGHASGSAVGILNGKKITYRGVFGAKAPDAGSEIPADEALCSACLKTSQVLRCPDVNPEFLLNPEECKRRGIRSLIAVPVFHQGAVTGALELYYDEPLAFSEQDVHTCQLMAGLVTEALVRDEELTLKKSLADERAAMLQALEKLQPNLAALVSHSNAGNPPVKNETTTPPPPPVVDFACRKCGHKLVGEEMFCGQCGSPRNGDYEAPSMQSKLATMWEMQEAQKATAHASDGPTPLTLHEDGSAESFSGDALAHALEQQMPDLFRESEMPVEESAALNDLTASLDLEGLGHDDIHSNEIDRDEHDKSGPSDADATVEEEAENASTAALAPKLTKPADWSSAASAREFLEQLASSKRSGRLVHFWNTRRGDIYLAIAIVLVLCVVRWGISSSRGSNPQAASTPATTNAANAKAPVPTSAPAPAPDPDLSLFDRIMIQLGLADPPAAPEDKGNPSVQVWVDQKTGQYYCPGSDGYGKTPKGKYTTQRDAQLDQFEPASRKPCN